MIELMLTVTMVGIVASIAIPSLSRARAISMEVSTIGSLRTLNTAQVSYASTCGGGFFAPSIVWLATKPTGAGQAAFVGPEFTSNTVDRQGYRIRLTAGAVAAAAPKTCNGLAKGRAVQSYFIGADPLRTGTGQGVRHFGTSSSNTIYESSKRIAAFQKGVPPKPAKAIQ